MLPYPLVIIDCAKVTGMPEHLPNCEKLAVRNFKYPSLTKLAERQHYYKRKTRQYPCFIKVGCLIMSFMARISPNGMNEGSGTSQKKRLL